MDGKYGLKHLFEDDNRLIGGNSDSGGLADVNYNWSDNHNDNIAFRSLIASSLFNSLNPTAEHFTNLDELRGKLLIFIVIKTFSLPRESQKYF